MKKQQIILFSFISMIFLFSASAVQAQKKTNTVSPKLEDLPCIPIDTLPTSDEDTKIILYTNNTWRYYRPELEGKYGGLPTFNDFWETDQIFAYRSVGLSELPQVVDLNLISSLDEFHPPITGKVFSKYGRRGRRNHNGVDIPLKTGEPIYAVFDGRVRYSKYNTGGFGNMVIVRHQNGLETYSAHLSKRNVEEGEYVKAGQIIGYGGSTGRSRGPHLHFEVRYYDQTFDPEHLFDFENGNIKYQTFALEKSYFNINSRASDQLEDHDFDDLAALVSADGEEITSEDILNHIAQAQTGGKSSNNRITSSDSGEAVYHTVKSGDMLGTISRRYGVSIDQICRLNGITRTTVLQINRRLRVK